MTYYRELGGINGAITVTQRICSLFNIQAGKATHRVNNQAALTNCFGPDKRDASTPGLNLIKKIKLSTQSSTIK